MSPIRHFDHVGITVKDLDTVTAFFVGLGFETEGRTVLEGEFLDTVIGIPDARTEIVMLRPPGGGTGQGSMPVACVAACAASADGEPDAVPGRGRGLSQCSGLSFELNLIAQRDPAGARRGSPA